MQTIAMKRSARRRKSSGTIGVGVGAMLPGSNETRLELQPPSPGRVGQLLSGVTMDQRFVIDGEPQFQG